MKKSIILIAALFVALGTAIGVLVYKNTPKNLTMRALSSAVEDATEREDVEVLLDVVTQGSVSVSMSELRYEDQNLMEDASIRGKLYFDESAIMAEDVYFEMDGIAISGDVYLSDKMVYISEEKILNEAIGITYKKLADELEKSIFAYGSGSDYEITDKETYEKLLKICESLEDDKIKEDAEDLVKDLTKSILKIFFDNVEIESEKDTMRIGGEKRKVRVITITVNGEMFAAFLNDLYDFLDKDDAIDDFLAEHEEFLLPLLDELDILNTENVDSLRESYRDALEELEDEIDSICDEIEDDDSEAELQLVTPRSSKKLLKIAFNVENGSEISLDFGGEGIKKAECITLEVGNMAFVYEIEQNDRKAFINSFSVNGEEVFELELDKQQDAFVLNVGDARLKGSFEEGSGGKYTFGIERIIPNRSYAPEEVYRTDWTIVFDTKDSIPKAPKNYTTIDELTDKKIESWIEKIEDLK